MTIISALQTYIATHTSIDEVHINLIGHEPVEYAIVPMSGARVVDKDIMGNTTREYPFALQFSGFTTDDAAMLESSGFCEDFASWLDSQTESGAPPTLDEGQTATKIEAIQNGILFETSESQVGIYQIVCKLTYEQSA